VNPSRILNALTPARVGSELAMAAARFVAAKTGFTVEELIGDRRTSRLCDSRFLCYWLARRRGMTLGVIGSALGGKDHGSVLNGVRAIDDDAKQWPKADTALKALEAEFLASLEKNGQTGGPSAH
jgi:chromosomal replication initiation ATPase DnaA